MSSAAETSSRLRLVVIATLLGSLFVTLGVRLYYVQVVRGDTYQTVAKDESMRKIILQPARGLIVDDRGVPLANNRSVVDISLDRAVLAKMPTADRATALKRASQALHLSTSVIEKKIRTFRGGTVEPVPLVSDAAANVWIPIQEQPEVYKELVVNTSDTARNYPAPGGVNAADILGYISSITSAEYAKAQASNDPTLNATSVVGRAGVEQTYDKWLRGVPGYRAFAVDPNGQPIGGEGGEEIVQPQAGDTLVTSIDSRVQALAEQQLNQAIQTARNTVDTKVTHRKFVADWGAVVVMQAKTGRIVAMAQQPTYDPNMWVGGISTRNYTQLQSSGALLSRALQAQFPPGSTWKPFMTVGALSAGMAGSDKLDCSSGLMIGNRNFGNFDGESLGYIDFGEALAASCDTFFYRVGLHFWNQYGSNPADQNAKDPLGAMARQFGFGTPTGVDIPGESTGLVGDRQGKYAYWKQLKNYYCGVYAKNPTAWDARDFCIEGNYFRQGDAANFTIGQGENAVTPMQLARAYAALSNGGTVFEPTVGKAIVGPNGTVIQAIKPKVVRHVNGSAGAIDYVNNALIGTLKGQPAQPFNGTLAWKFGGFPVDQLGIRGKTGSAEGGVGKSSTGWVATYNKDYVVVMVIDQAGTGSGSSGDAVRAIWSALYGVGGPANAQTVDPKNAIFPNGIPTALPKIPADGGLQPAKGTQP
ncbi:penicillin-binding protein 2 [Nocardioides baekrokdamisoli]|uniref:Penicillin-binding protein 2 n=1 Tax=Nocardioides baekrokdamisoli TaxID=1804624 RepID=A0A3G9J507_9ACTN|nr:penicillin-binding transpeptidase domain-containing protein [Nocardioides baekrokdamisoli]BBH18079.1 penicillin-binding protein 2 [Nocardioides baekrokdamisoli]